MSDRDTIYRYRYGSTSADTSVQHLQYLPFGEPFVDQHTTGCRERFRFTGNAPRKGKRIPLNKNKNNEQRDEETGYGYFGARYMDHELMTMWLSVDPMADKYPSISPYAYCAWNPLKVIDKHGDSLTLSAEAWKVMQRAFWSTFDKKTENVPFEYSSETGLLSYVEREGVTYSPEQQQIIDHISSLCRNETYNVIVDVVDNDYLFYNKGERHSLREGSKISYGTTVYGQNSATVFISRDPMYTRDDRIVRCPHAEAIQSVAIMHEIGGHAYYHSQNIRDKRENGSLTEKFENMVRSIFKGRDWFETREIRTGRALPCH